MSVPSDRSSMPDQGQGTDSGQGVYMYGICLANSAPDVSRLRMRDEVYAIGSAGLVAYVRTVNLSDYSEDALKEQAANSEWLIAEAKGHHSVVAEIHQTSAILPAKFGSIYESVDVVRQALEDMADQVKPRLELLSDCDEWAIHVHCDSEGMLEHVLERDPQLRELSRDVEEASEGRSYMLRRQFQNRLQKAFDAYQEELASGVIEELGQWTTAVHREEPRESEGEGPAEVTRASVLVRRKDVDSFLEHAEHIHSTREGLQLEITGPWPPYTFATVIAEDSLDG